MSMRHRFLLAAAFAAVGTFAGAQEQPEQTVVLPSPIMVVDFDRIIGESLYGKRIAVELNAERARVQAENDQIVAELEAEEEALTNARATMEPEAFRAAAEAFGERAQSVRASRDAEQTRLVQQRDARRARFLERIQPILTAMMVERGAVVAMDRRAVIRVIGSANATQDAIAAIDATLGDGVQEPSERPTLRPTPQDPIDPLALPLSPDLSVSD